MANNITKTASGFWSKFLNGKLEKEDFIVFGLIGLFISSIFKFSISTRKK